MSTSLQTPPAKPKREDVPADKVLCEFCTDRKSAV